MEKLRWVFELIDRVTSPAGRIDKALEQVNTAMGRVRGGSQALQNTFGGFGGPIGIAVGALQLMGGALLDLGVGFAKAAIGGMGFKERTIGAFTSMTGSADHAGRLYDQAVKFAAVSPFSNRQVAGQLKQAMGAGFSERQSMDLMAGLSDVALVGGGGAQAMEGMMRQIAQAKAIGKFQGQDLNAIMSWGAGSGFNSGALFEVLGKSRGVDPGKVRDMLSSGAITADEGIKAMLAVIGKYVSKGELGAATLRLSSTLDGVLERISSAPDNLWDTIDIDSTGFKQVTGFLGSMSSTLEKMLAKGGPLQSMFQGLVNKVGGFLSKFTEADMLAMFDKLVAGITAFGDGLGPGLDQAKDLFAWMTSADGKAIGFADTMKTLGKAVGYVAEAFSLMAGALVAVTKGIGDLFGPNSIDWSFAGKSAVDGLAKGMSDFHPIDAVTELMVRRLDANIRAPYPRGIESHSPSKLFADIGEMIPAGLAMGIAHGMPAVNASLSNLATPVGLPSAGGGGGVSITVPIELTVHGAGGDADGVARRLTDLLPDALQGVFRRLAEESGVA